MTTLENSDNRGLSEEKEELYEKNDLQQNLLYLPKSEYSEDNLVKWENPRKEDHSGNLPGMISERSGDIVNKNFNIVNCQRSTVIRKSYNVFGKGSELENQFKEMDKPGIKHQTEGMRINSFDTFSYLLIKLAWLYFSN